MAWEYSMDAVLKSRTTSITKPFLHMVLDPRFMDANSESTVQPFDTLIALLQTTRRVLIDLTPHVKDWYINSDSGHIVITDANMTRIREYACKVGRHVFHYKSGKFTTHDLRRYYVAYTYALYASHSAKEAAFTRLILGHSNMGVSLNYNNLTVSLGT